MSRLWTPIEAGERGQSRFRVAGPTFKPFKLEEVMDHGKRIELLARLGRRAAAGGMRVQLRDAVPRLVLTSAAGSVINVFITDLGEFAWRPVDRVCPLKGVEAAADALLSFVTKLDAVSGSETHDERA